MAPPNKFCKTLSNAKILQLRFFVKFNMYGMGYNLWTLQLAILDICHSYFILELSLDDIRWGKKSNSYGIERYSRV